MRWYWILVVIVIGVLAIGYFVLKKTMTCVKTKEGIKCFKKQTQQKDGDPCTLSSDANGVWLNGNCISF